MWKHAYPTDLFFYVWAHFEGKDLTIISVKEKNPIHWHQIQKQ